MNYISCLTSLDLRILRYNDTNDATDFDTRHLLLFIFFKTSIEPFPLLEIIPCLDKLLRFLNLKQKRTMEA